MLIDGQTKGVLDGVLTSIIEDLVSDIYRKEKCLLMQSATAICNKEVFDRMGDASVTGKNAASGPSVPDFKLDATIYEKGAVLLKEDGLSHMTEVICPQCKLPRLRFPIAGFDGKVPSEDDLKRKWCTKHPWVLLAGHDCHGAPFPVMSNNKQKEPPYGTVPWYLKELDRPQKSQNYFPYVSCPWCKEENPQTNKSVVAFHFAKHADSRSCVRVRGNRNAKTNEGTTASNTPSASRISTPVPGSQKDADDTKDTAGDEDVPKKPKKKSSYVKKADRERMAATAAANSANDKAEKEAAKENGETGKRARDETGNDDSPRKKTKVEEGS